MFYTVEHFNMLQFLYIYQRIQDHSCLIFWEFWGHTWDPTLERILSHQSSVQFSSVTQSCLTLQPHGLQHARLPCPSPTLRACSNSCSSSQWCHPTIWSSVIPFSCLQSFPVSGSFPMSQVFASGGQSIGVSASASVLPMNIQDWFPLGLTVLPNKNNYFLSGLQTCARI